MDTTPFLTEEEFAALIAPRTLTVGEKALVKLLLQAAADWIRDPTRLPNLGRSDAMATQAKIVTYDVVSAVLGPQNLDPRVRQAMTQVDGRTTSLTYAEVGKLLDWDDRHLLALGLSTTAVPQARFDDFGVAFDDAGVRQW